MKLANPPNPQVNKYRPDDGSGVLYTTFHHVSSCIGVGGEGVHDYKDNYYGQLSWGVVAMVI